MILAEHQTHSLIDLRRPVNRRHWAARGLVAWWKVLPGWYGGRQWFNLMSPHHADLTSLSGGGWRPSTRSFGQMQFDGVGYCDAPITQTFTAISLLTWVRPNGTGGTLVSRGSSGFAGSAWDWRFTSTGAVFETFGTQIGQSTVPWTVGAWNYAAVTCTAGDKRHYLHGLPTSTHVENLSDTSRSINIGRMRRGDILLNGAMDDVMIYDHVLSAAEVRALYDLSRRAHPGLLNRIPLRAGFSGSAEAVVATQQCGFESLRSVEQTAIAGHESLATILASQSVPWESRIASVPTPSPYRPQRPRGSPQRFPRPSRPTKRY